MHGVVRHPWAILCDFDGTALAFDLGDQVALHFAGEAHYRAEEDRYREGAFVFSELLRRIYTWGHEQDLVREGVDLATMWDPPTPTIRSSPPTGSPCRPAPPGSVCG